MIYITIALFAALVVAVIFAILNKKKRIVWMWTSALYVLLAAGSVALTAADKELVDIDRGFYTITEPDKTSDGLSETSEEDERGYISIISWLLDEGETDLARTLLDEYSENAEYNAEYMSLVADVYEAEGNEERAEIIRNSLRGTAFETGNLSVRMDKDAEAAAKAYYAINELSSGTDESGYYYGDLDVNTLYEYIKDWADRDFPFSKLPSINRALLAAELYLHDYTNTANNVMTNPDGDTLIVASQLIRSGKLGDDDIRDNSFILSIQADQREVLNHIKKERDKNKFSAEKNEIINSEIRVLQESLNEDTNILYEYVADTMEAQAESGDESAAKLCLELADIAYENGDNAKAAKYVEKTLTYAANSSDAEFAAAAGQINDIIQSNDNAEDRKLITDYVDRMIEKRMPDGIPDIDTDVMDGISGYHQEDESDSGILDEYTGDNFLHNGPADGNSGEEASVTSDLSSGGELSQNISDTINQMAGSINVVSVDTDEFPSLYAVVAVDDNYVSTAAGFKENMRVTDAEADIENYEVEKIEYDDINIVLVCDDSGSMAGNPRDCLSDALKAFAENKSDDVNIGIVPFSDGVLQDMVSMPGASRDEIIATADGLRASGGTNIYDAVTYANTIFPEDDNSLNIMILMSDGNDTMPDGEDMEAIRAACVNRDIVIYTVGLGGDVNAELLEEYASYGSGEYFYVDTPESIEAFYNFIYNTGKNRYRISFEAVDTYKIDRRLEVRYNTSPTIYGEQYYSLYSSDIEDKLNDEDISITVNDVVINGLKEKMVYYANYSQNVTLRGEGLEKDAVISVELKGGAGTYTCTTEYVDESSVTVTVPAKVPVGLYDVYVTYNGKKAVFGSSFIVSGGESNVVRFGEYVFTTSNLKRNGDYAELSGVVTLNGWLGFTDTVTLQGDLENDYDIQMSYGKTYMQYTDENAGGLAGYYAKKGYTTQLPGYMTVTLYNDPAVSGSSDDYPVQNVPVAMLGAVDFLSIETAGLAIYPDRAKINFREFTTKLPFQDKIISAAGGEVFKFSVDYEAELIYSNNSIDCVIEVGYENQDPDVFSNTKVGNMYANVGEFGIKLDTKKGEVELKALANIAMLIKGVGFEIGIKDWKLDKIMFYADKDITVSIKGINVTFSDFGLGIQDISQAVGSEDWTDIFKAEMVGKCDASLAKISSYFPGVEKYVGDVSILSLDDVTLAFRLKEFRIRAEATAKCLGLIEVGSAKLQLGIGLEYNNPLFVLQDSPDGFIGEVSIGPKIETDNFKLQYSGGVNVALTNQVIGLWSFGDFELKVSWWVFVAEAKYNGDVFFGAYTQHNGKMAFGIIAACGGTGGNNISVVWGADDAALATHKF